MKSRRHIRDYTVAQPIRPQSTFSLLLEFLIVMQPEAEKVQRRTHQNDSWIYISLYTLSTSSHGQKISDLRSNSYTLSLKRLMNSKQKYNNNEFFSLMGGNKWHNSHVRVCKLFYNVTLNDSASCQSNEQRVDPNSRPALCRVSWLLRY